MDYDQQILKVLTEAGNQGVSVQTIAKHVYNMNITLFHQPVYDEVRTYVQHYLLRNSKSAQSIVERTGRRGYYRLNAKGSQDARQLLFQFRENKEEKTEEEIEKPQQDLSLDLFEGFF